MEIRTAEMRLAELANSPAVGTIAEALGEPAKLHLVGGTVRDLLLGRAVADIDCACKILPEEILRRLNAAGVHVVPTG